jgi:hypothetical protein
MSDAMNYLGAVYPMKPKPKAKGNVSKDRLAPEGLCTQCGGRAGRFLTVAKEYGRRKTIGAEWLCERCFSARNANKGSREHEG